MVSLPRAYVQFSFPAPRPYAVLPVIQKVPVGLFRSSLSAHTAGMSGTSRTVFAPQPPVIREKPGKAVSQPAFLFVLFIAALIIGAVLQTVGPAWVTRIFQLNAGLAQSTYTLALALAISVLIHELGHLIPSLCFGFHVSRVVIGPIAAARTHGRWRVAYSRSWFSASVAATPCDDFDWRARMLTVIAGGPMATLWTFLGAALLLQTVPLASSAACFFSALAQINLFLFVLGLVPNSNNAAVRSDARLFLTVLRNGEEAEQIKLYQQVTRLQIEGVRPSAYPVQLISRLAITTGNYDLMLFNALTIFLWALDSGDLATADAWDRYANRLIEDHVLKLSNAVLAESACFDVLHRHNAVAAIKKLTAANTKLFSPWLKYRAQAVLQIAEGSYSNALASISNARASLPAPQPYLQFESAVLDRLQNRATVSHAEPLVARAVA